GSRNSTRTGSRASMATISQRISMEGAEDIRRKLLELGRAGEQAFKQIQAAAAKPIIDPAQIDNGKQALDQLAQAAENTGTAFKSAASEATKLGVQIGVVAGVAQALTNKLLGMAAALKTALAPSELLKGAVETGKAISDQANKLKLTVPEWLKLSKAIADAGVSQEDFIKGA